METICDYLLVFHERCDGFFARLEESIDRHDWSEAGARFRLFRDALEHHLRMEEEILFPAFEQALRNSGEPLKMLNTEHQQIRCIIDRISDSVIRADPADFLLHTESPTLLLRQHSQKEEEMLYPLLDRILALSAMRYKIIQAMCVFLDMEDHGATT